jgi:RNA recognition motif-containing protein
MEGNFQASSSAALNRTRVTFEELLQQADPNNTSVYVGNISQEATDEDLRTAFNKFGNIVSVRNFKAQHHAFVKFSSVESAARAIHEMANTEFMGQFIRCSWGKPDVSSLILTNLTNLLLGSAQ